MGPGETACLTEAGAAQTPMHKIATTFGVRVMVPTAAAEWVGKMRGRAWEKERSRARHGKRERKQRGQGKAAIGTEVGIHSAHRSGQEERVFARAVCGK